MADPWLAPAELIGCTKGGGTYDGSPYRIVLHTVEGDPGTVDGCRSMAETHGSPPQLWYHPTLRWLGQGLPLDRSGYALGHPSGTPETNKAGAIQCEIFGFASDTPGWSTELDNIGVDVVGSIVAAGWPIDLDRVAPTAGSNGYGTDGAVRASRDQWSTFTGLCVHANVPDNDHWDAGAIDLRRIADAAAGEPVPEPVPEPEYEDEMALSIVAADTGDGTQYVTDLATFKTVIPSPEARDQIIWCTVAAGGRIYYADPNNPTRVSGVLLDALPTTAP